MLQSLERAREPRISRGFRNVSTQHGCFPVAVAYHLPLGTAVHTLLSFPATDQQCHRLPDHQQQQPIFRRCSDQPVVVQRLVLWSPDSAENRLGALVVPQLQFIDIFVDFPGDPHGLVEIPQLLCMWWSMSLSCRCSRFHRCSFNVAVQVPAVRLDS